MKSVMIFIILLVIVTGNTNEINNKRWIERFSSKPAQAFLRSLESIPRDKTQHHYDQHKKKDEISPNYDSIVKTDIQDFPSIEQTKKMMFAMFGEEGLYVREDFKASGEIHIEGSALISVWKIFPNKTVLLEEFRTSKNAVIGSSVFSVMTQMLFLPQDVSKLEEWLEKGIEIGDEENDIPCSPKVVINYKCCELTGEPILEPEFGSIQMGID